MFRTAFFLAIALGVAAIAAATNPAAAFPGASPTLKPIEVQYGQLPRPQTVPTLRPSRCMLVNCMAPARPTGR
jgi:hypothetical protein